MKKASLPILSLLLFLTVLSVSCTTDSGFNIPEPTFDNVPGPFDLNEAEEEPVQDGIVKYIVEEGRGVDQVVIRDDISFFVTLRAQDGEILYSSYQDDSTSPDQRSVQSITPPQIVRSFGINRALTDGLRKGIIGMREGEKRTLFVPPSQGFEDSNSGSLNAPYREDTLRYDIELDFIF